MKMLLQDSLWEKIRGQFSEEEKAALNAAVRGQAICPKGAIIDLDALPEELRKKVEEAKG